MFDFDAGKLVIIGIVALVVIGPKELPRVLRYVGQSVGKMRRLAADFQAQFMEAMKEADVADIKADVAKLAESAKLDVNFNPIYDLKTQITDAVHGSQADAVPATAEVPAIAAPESQEQPNVSNDIGDAAEAGVAPFADVKAVPEPEAPAPAEPVHHEPAPHDAEPTPLRNSA